MMHGDDQGLRLPPDLAPIQTVVVPIWRTEEDKTAVLESAHAVCAELSDASVRAHVDDRDQRPGWKFNEWEVRGVPLRIEIGPRDVAAGTVVVVRRDTGEKQSLDRSAIASAVPEFLAQVHAGLLAGAGEVADSMTVDAADMAALRDAVEAGLFVRAWWAGTSEDEARIQEETGATIRCMPLDHPPDAQPCVLTGAGGARLALFGRAY
jgi:prolyl-tRNA synthetase